MSEVYKKFTAQDFAVVPFNAHKQYDFTSASAATNKIKYYATEWVSESISLYTSASGPYGGDTKNVVKYRQLDNSFYKNYKRDINNKLGTTHYVYQKRNLHHRANILSTPAGLYGNEIKPGSVYISSSAVFTDDLRGNLIVSGTNVDEYVHDIDNIILKIGPEKGFKKYDLSVHSGYLFYDTNKRSPFYLDGQLKSNPPTSYSTPGFGDEFDDSYYFNLLRYNGVQFAEQTLKSGMGSWPCISFSGSATNTEIRTGHRETYNFNQKDDFTISFWVKLKAGSDGTNSTPAYIISKSTTKTIVPAIVSQRSSQPRMTTSTGSSQPIDVPSAAQFPFEVYYKSNKIEFSRSDGQRTATAKSATLTSTNWNHITCRYSGGELKVFANGAASGTTDNDSLSTHFKKSFQNKANIYIGNKGGKSNYMQGDLSQIQIYNVALSNTQVTNHYNQVDGSPYIGNCFYSIGITTITHPGYINALKPGTNELLQYKFKGTHLIYEHEYQCTIDEHEFNDTLNTSARPTRSTDDPNLADFATGSLFKPYITTIGLYNEQNDLLVVAKLGSPIRVSDETDTTFVVRWDT